MEPEQHSPQIALWLKLIRADGIGPTLFKRLLDFFGGVERIFTASVTELTKVEGIGNKTAESIVRTRDAFDVDSELAAVDCRSDRIDEERHVVVDHLHERKRRRVAVLFFIGVEDSQKRLSGSPYSAELEVIECRACHYLRRAPVEILERYVDKVLLEVALDV